MTVYLFHVVEKKKRKSPCSFASSKKPSKSKAYEFVRYIVRAGRKLRTTAKTNLQIRTQKSHGRTNCCLQSLARKSREISFLPVLSRGCDLLENVSASFALCSSWIVSYENKHRPTRNFSENFLTSLVARAAEFRSCKGYFPIFSARSNI